MSEVQRVDFFLFVRKYKSTESHCCDVKSLYNGLFEALLYLVYNLWFSHIKKQLVSVFEAHWVHSVSLSLSDELFMQVKASESPRSISILASSRVSGVTASWGKKIIEIRPPPALCLWPSQPS